jgi:hypothetical protein
VSSISGIFMTNTNLQAINHVNKNVALGLVMGQSLD